MRCELYQSSKPKNNRELRKFMPDIDRLANTFNEIIQKYDRSDDLLISTAYGDGGAQNPFPRLHRAVVNQIEGGDATLSRYAIWANTVRDNLIEFTKIREEDPDQAIKHLKVVVNSLSCFCDIQARFDPFEHGEKDKSPVKLDLL